MLRTELEYKVKPAGALPIEVITGRIPRAEAPLSSKFGQLTIRTALLVTRREGFLIQKLNEDGTYAEDRFAFLTQGKSKFKAEVAVIQAGPSLEMTIALAELYGDSRRIYARRLVENGVLKSEQLETASGSAEFLPDDEARTFLQDLTKATLDRSSTDLALDDVARHTRAEGAGMFRISWLR